MGRARLLPAELGPAGRAARAARSARGRLGPLRPGERDAPLPRPLLARAARESTGCGGAARRQSCEGRGGAGAVRALPRPVGAAVRGRGPAHGPARTADRGVLRGTARLVFALRGGRVRREGQPRRRAGRRARLALGHRDPGRHARRPGATASRRLGLAPRVTSASARRTVRGGRGGSDRGGARRRPPRRRAAGARRG